MSTETTPENDTAPKRRRKALHNEESPDLLIVETRLRLPLIPLRDNVVFPRQIAPLAAARSRSVGSLETAVSTQSQVILAIQRSPEGEDITKKTVYPVGIVAAVGAFRRLPAGAAQALVEGQQRVRIRSVSAVGDAWFATVDLLADDPAVDTRAEAAAGSIKQMFSEYVAAGGGVTPDMAVALAREDDPAAIADYAASAPEISLDTKIELLQETRTAKRLTALLPIYARLLEVAKLRAKITEDVQRTMNNTQREHILREQLQALRKELSEISGDREDDEEDTRSRIESLPLPEEVRHRVLKELNRLEQIPTMSPEVGIVRSWIDLVLDLPWDHTPEKPVAIADAQAVLDQDHYGLMKVKNRILEWLAVRQRILQRLEQQRNEHKHKDHESSKLHTPILCFVGPPGVGKTSLGKSIATALDRPFIRLSLGGVRDEAEIRGHRRTYIGALPGRILQAMRQAGTTNPVIMLDEIDKIGADFRGDPSAALLEVLDPEQNFEFRDHYLEIPYDLSDVLFITTANMMETIMPALRDRMEIIRISGYTEEEKRAIATRHLLPRQLREHALTSGELRIPDDVIGEVIHSYTHEAGVRQLDRSLAEIARKIPKLLETSGKKRITVTSALLEEFLGPKRYFYGEAREEDEVGTVTGVVVSEVGGDIVTVESIAIQGSSGFTLTGQIGEVMEESARTALSWVRAHADEYGVEKGFFDGVGFHVHVPQAAIPKDGPSAGVTIVVALMSTASKRPVRRDLAMTGEVTLRGQVLPVGGIKDKLLAARRSGILTFILPEKNMQDLAEIDGELLAPMTVIPVRHVSEVLKHALLPAPSVQQRRAVGFALPLGHGPITS
ncbi:MAG: endopeptidase La [Candidatus Dormibacteria bacterium]